MPGIPSYRRRNDRDQPARADLQYRRRKPRYSRRRNDRNQALVTLTDSVTGRRRDDWLGEYGTPESRERYHRLVAEWEARGRRLPPPEFEGPAVGPAAGVRQHGR